MIYLYTVENANIYRYVIYLFVFAVFAIMENSYLRKNKKDNYLFGILELCMLMAIFEYEFIFIYTVGVTLLTIALEGIVRKIFKKKRKNTNILPIASYLCFSNIIVIIIVNYFACKGGY